MDIREARPEEHQAAGHVAVEGYGAVYRRLGPYAERLRDVGERAKDSIVLVGVEAGEIVATATYVPDPSSAFAEGQRGDEASIRMLAVAPSHMRRGIGRALSIACIERARAEGKRAVMLHADAAVAGARRMYEGLGFRRDPDRDWAPDEETFLVCYVLDL